MLSSSLFTVGRHALDVFDDARFASLAARSGRIRLSLRRRMERRGRHGIRHRDRSGRRWCLHVPWDTVTVLSGLLPRPTYGLTHQVGIDRRAIAMIVETSVRGGMKNGREYRRIQLHHGIDVHLLALVLALLLPFHGDHFRVEVDERDHCWMYSTVRSLNIDRLTRVQAGQVLLLLRDVHSVDLSVVLLEHLIEPR